MEHKCNPEAQPRTHLQVLTDNREDYINQMIGFKIKKLRMHYELVGLQLEKAYKDQNHKAHAVLTEMSSQILEAMVNKQFPD